MKLPLNCEVEYLQHFLPVEEAAKLFSLLLEQFTPPTFEVLLASGECFKTETGKITFMDEALYAANRFPANVWGQTAVWPEPLRKVKEQVEALTGHSFQVGVGILYPDGNTGIDYHSDLVAFGDTSFIPSLSLGEERRFSLREKATRKESSLPLYQGSLIIMGAHCQERYEHSLPIDPGCSGARVNVTFRKVDEGS
ncbi:alpha-ketoglutarate-dependent dioxygenase AlkB [Neolewinella agarilytica]|uniref:alpha-ketoglutarate-dependent dioxygenase AlkB n=1 Tax=Neolewinella agarilytica TaxID=478744 RepID=UPI002353E579|nr:alpha-ketoglutarate-dependent dioxygenase AlkB [Neolewinella agarilytica]